MKKLDQIFAYTYYRINERWLKWGFNDEGHVLGIMAMSQTIFLLDVWLIVYTTFFVDLKDYQMPDYLKPIGVVVVVFFMFMNFKRYKNNYFIYMSKWKHEPIKVRRIKGWLIVIWITLVHFAGAIYLSIFGI